MSGTAGDLLQQFLNRGLLNIGDDDVRLGYFREASKSVAENWAKNRSKLIPAVLATLDPNVPATDSIIKETEEALQAHWNTYRNAYPDSPRQFLRAIALESLRQVASEDVQCAGAIWLTGKSIAGYHDLGREKDVVWTMLQELGKAHESAAQKWWAGSESAIAEIKVPRLATAKVDVKTLEERLGAASGPHNAQSQAYKDPRNTQWPNNGPPWSYVFPSIAAPAIADATNAAITSAVTSVATGLKDFAQAATVVLKTAQAQNGPSGPLGRLRLLWWRQAMYSPTAARGYRELPPLTAAAMMAVDLAGDTHFQTPTSVEYLLREAVREIPLPDDVGELTLRQAMTGAFGTATTQSLHAALGRLHAPTTDAEKAMRFPLIEIARHATEGGALPSEIFERALGLTNETRITISDFAVWLFRDLQAERLLKRSTDSAS